LAFCGQYTRWKLFKSGKGGATVQNFDDFFTMPGLYSCFYTVPGLYFFTMPGLYSILAATQVCFNKQDVTFKMKIIEYLKYISAKNRTFDQFFL